MRAFRLLSVALAAALLVGVAGCSSDPVPTPAAAGASGAFPVTVEHAYGSTTIRAKPTRIATVSWSNAEVPLALGVVPVGMDRADYGDEDGDGVLPWVKARLDELGAATPVLFDGTDGIDFEAVADTEPDVILAAYSGLSKTDYETLSRIAPTIAYPGVAWGTTVDQMITMESEAMGMAAEGRALIERLDAQVDADVAKHPALAGRSVLFGYFDPSDLSRIGFYTTHDTRPAFLSEVGTTTPKAVADASAKTDAFSTTVSAEQADAFDDVDVIVTYGDAALLEQLQADPLIGRIPAVQRGSVVLLEDDTALAASANPSPLSIASTLDEYLGLIATAAEKAG